LGVSEFFVGADSLTGLPVLPLAVVGKVGVATVFPLLPVLVLVGGLVSGSSAASASGCCGFLPSFGGEATGFGFFLGASSGFFPAVGRDFCFGFSFGFSGFSSVTTFGLFGRVGLLSSSVIGLPTFLAVFVVVVSVLAFLAGVASLFLLSVFLAILGGDLLDTVVQFSSSSFSSVPANVSSKFMGAVELVFLTAPECELLDPDEVLERLEWLDPLEVTDDASLVVFPELFAV